ncbi:hypothetical protein GCM10011571_15080 [Marinithermofilum abyssi]|uniref:Uncharacterized protein n=1 Tax=Marinithermofilum abyssi TaxID=1571185 RepID=A0A8J2VIA1_9BACL|nr:hypothetical protein [Marinithermofilum abyssi]GGE14610.1 hypothetical protein GCM10011571_15080 [Marinithermofilum abyssi]
MAKGKSRDQLRSLIREMIQEELNKIMNEETEQVMRKDFHGEEWMEGLPVREEKEEKSLRQQQPEPGPPWAVFGEPRLAPDAGSEQATEKSVQRPWSPFDPDFDMEPPPFIPRRNREKE